MLGDRFTVADAYLFVVTNWARGVKFDLGGLPNIEAFRKRMGTRKSVLQAMRAESLIKDAGPAQATAA